MAKPQTKTDPEEFVPSKTRALIENRMPQRSLAQLEREIGLENLGRRLLQAEHGHYIPMDMLAAVQRATGISAMELLWAMVDDAGYPELLPPLSPAAVEVVLTYLEASESTQVLVGSFLAWVRDMEIQLDGPRPEDGQT